MYIAVNSVPQAVFRAFQCVKYARIWALSDPNFFAKERIFDSVFIRENASQKKLVFWHILRSA